MNGRLSSTTRLASNFSQTVITDLSIPATLEKIQEKAGEGRWVEAQELAERAIENLTTFKPAPLYKAENAGLITACNYDEHLERLATADWVLEAVARRCRCSS